MLRRPLRRSVAVWQWAVPLGGFVTVLAVLGAVVFQMAAGAPPNVVSREAAAQLAPPTDDPYSLSSLYRRLPKEGVEQVARYLEYFRKDRRRGLEDGLSRSTRYMPHFRKIFAALGVPEELAYLPLIESGFVEHAVSPAKAVGVWQFIEETGRRFNLHSNSWFDKRRDPIGSASAAAQYLRSLYGQFKDWDLALAAYNSGAGTVRWAVRANRKAKLPTGFWALELPEETRNYVPAFIAAVLIAKNPGAFGFNKIRFMPRMTYEWIKVSSGIPLAVLARQFEIPEEALFELNPELIRRQVPPGDAPYLLRIPPGTRSRVPAKLTGGEKSPRDWVLYQVAATDTLQELALRYRAKPDTILRVNRLQGSEQLAERAFLIIPL